MKSFISITYLIRLIQLPVSGRIVRDETPAYIEETTGVRQANSRVECPDFNRIYSTDKVVDMLRSDSSNYAYYYK